MLTSCLLHYWPPKHVLLTQVYKVAPYYPPLSSFHPQLSFGDEDVEFLVQNGYSMVRLFVSWRGVEPEKDSYNSSYLDVSKWIVLDKGRENC